MRLTIAVSANAVLVLATAVLLRRDLHLLQPAGAAWPPGPRHAFDADHVATFGGAVHHLADSQHSGLFADLFFSLDRCTFVLIVSLLVGMLGSSASFLVERLHAPGTLVGCLVSGCVLFGIANGVVLLRASRSAAAVRPAGLRGAVTRLALAARRRRSLPLAGAGLAR